MTAVRSNTGRYSQHFPVSTNTDILLPVPLREKEVLWGSFVVKYTYVYPCVDTYHKEECTVTSLYHLDLGEEGLGILADGQCINP